MNKTIIILAYIFPSVQRLLNDKSLLELQVEIMKARISALNMRIDLYEMIDPCERSEDVQTPKL